MSNEASEPTKAVTESPRGRGRPASITLEVVQQIGSLIAKGMTEEQACTRVGVNHSSFRTARHRNPEFETAVKEAQADYLAESVELIGQGARGWQGRAWLLERRHGNQFRNKTSVELAHENRPLEELTDAELTAIIRAGKEAGLDCPATPKLLPEKSAG